MKYLYVLLLDHKDLGRVAQTKLNRLISALPAPTTAHEYLRTGFKGLYFTPDRYFHRGHGGKGLGMTNHQKGLKIIYIEDKI